MKAALLIPIILFIGCQSSHPSSSVLDYETEIERISYAATAFSKALIEEDIESIMSSYTKDAIIFPPRLDQIDTEEGIRSYWSPQPDRDMIYHMVIPEHIELHDSTAIDFGTYEGQVVFKGDTLDPFQGKYAIVWKLDSQNNWRMKYDIWNSSPNNLKVK